ncbi:MAG: 4Fe-4S binding protein [Desulfovibrio sp.]|jgi:ferredoxin-type protein NapF|nr:4Fe-4S binding protein [Desulfovibrio sp.]
MNPPFSRRKFLQWGGAGLAAAGVCTLTSGFGPAQSARPPGALDEPDFLARCSRCMRCVDVCFPLALRPAGWLDGGKNLGTPVLDPSKCIFCMECVRICPTGALSKIPKNEVDIGQVNIVADVCLAWLKTRRCDICFKACPTKAIVMKERRFPVLVPEKCNGCGICIRRCPQPGSLIMTSEGAKRYAPQPGRIIARLEDRVGPYDIPPPPWTEWFKNRVTGIVQRMGFGK